MSLFTLLKISRTRYLHGKKHVRPGTPVATKVVEESRYWYAYRRDGKRQVKIRLFTDKAASRSEVARLNTALERGEAGMTDPHKEHLKRPAADHLTEFLPVMREAGRSEKDKARKEAILLAFIATLGPLSDLKMAAVDGYLSGVGGSAWNREKHLSAISVFLTWLIDKKRICTNPLQGVTKPRGGKKTKERRALAAEQIQKLLDAARTRPLAAFHERYGTAVKESVRQKERAQIARDAAVAKYTLLGRERALVYKTAVYTGLRLGEIAALRPCHLELGRQPFPRLEIPGKMTKNGQQARLLLVPAFAEELAVWIRDTMKGPDDKLFHVPQAAVRIMQKDLRSPVSPTRRARATPTSTRCG